jgi:hypothetical protein
MGRLDEIRGMMHIKDVSRSSPSARPPRDWWRADAPAAVQRRCAARSMCWPTCASWSTAVVVDDIRAPTDHHDRDLAEEIVGRSKMSMTMRSLC